MSPLNPADLAAINTDQRMLFGIMLEARSTALPCKDEIACRQGLCDEGEHCHQLVRETFHRLLFATIGHFGRQERLIRPHIPLQSFQRHAEGHADISEAINNAIAAFSRTGNSLAAFADIHAIERMYEAHYLTLDAEVSAHIVQPQATASIVQVPLMSDLAHLPELPVTGDATIDAEHRQLFAILQRSRSVCLSLQSGCEECSRSQQTNCSASAIDLVTDTLKFMVEHFRQEESLLIDTQNGKVRDAHLQEHAELSRNLSQIVADYEDGNTALCIHRLSEVLHDWVKNHIVEHDIPLVKQYLLAKTLQQEAAAA